LELKERILQGIKSLPTLPTIYSALTEAMSDKLASPTKIAEVISTDQVSVFKILKVANSPFFGFRGRVDTISQAIMYLGFGEIRNIVFSLTVINFFSQDKYLKSFNPLDFWAHSIAVGISSRKIAKEIGERRLENFFLSGILHDIGKLIFIDILGEEYNEVFEYAKQNSCSINKAESEVLGINHAQAGHLIAEKWELPKSIQETIYSHHTLTGISDSNKLVRAVHLGDIMARALNLGNPGDKLIPQPDEKVWIDFGLPNGFFTSNYESILEDFEHTINLMLVE